MNKKIQLFIFIDALGWEILQAHPDFLQGFAGYRKPLKTILGYSSACDPSIISGLTPSEHLHWSSFYYSPKTGPFKWAGWLKFLPRFLTNHHRVRHHFSKLFKYLHGFTGYFQLYHVPFEYLPLFDYAEKKRLWAKEGMLQGKSIFDYLEEHHRSYYVGDLDSEEKQFGQVKLLMENRSIEFAYVLFGKLDAAMHKHGTRHPQVDLILEQYDHRIRELIKNAQECYEEVDFYLFSDHGMHNVTESYNLAAVIENLGYYYGIDYVTFYDSTMARFWFLNDATRKGISECLAKNTKGRILSNEELKQMGVYFHDYRYGETIFLMHSPYLIVPSFMGLKPVMGMHGYHPEDPDSLAMIMSNRQLPEDLVSIKDIAKLVMK